jgi:glycosyltransferase involved in cell wall biosynthesis
MKYLLFDHVPLDTETLKDSDKETTLAGTQVYTAGFARALLRYGSYDKYLFFSRNPFTKPHSSPLIERSDRASSVNLSDLHKLYQHREVVVASASPFMTARTPLRNRNPHHLWPMTGVIHSVCSVDIPIIALGLLHASFTQADALVCSSKAGRRVMESFFHLITGQHNQCPVELPIIPLGIEISDFGSDNEKEAVRAALGIPNDAVVLLYLGRLSPLSKGDLWPVLSTIAKEVLPRSQQVVQIIVAGDDTQHHMAEAIREYGHILGLTSSLRVYPDVSHDEKRTLLAASDIFLAPSDNIQETFGLAIVEAMASGLPIIAADWDGYRELFEDERSGFIIKTSWLNLGSDLETTGLYGTFWLRNAILASCTILDLNQLRDRLLLLVNNPDLRLQMGRHAREESRRYGWNHVIPSYETVWNSLLLRATDSKGPKSSGDFDPTSYPSQQVFAHYPSESIDDTASIRITPSGEQLLQSRQALSEVLSPFTVLNSDVAALLLAEIGTIKIEVIGNIATRLRDLVGPPFVIRTHLAQLLKYGLLEVVNTQDAPIPY